MEVFELHLQPHIHLELFQIWLVTAIYFSVIQVESGNMHVWILSVTVENGGHSASHSRSFFHLPSRNVIQRRSCTLI